jgi:hypothetical protein
MNPRFYNTDVATEHYLGIRWPRFIWQAVLEQAIRDIVEGPSVWEMRDMTLREMVAAREEFRVAAQCWVDDETNEPRRFLWVCELLGLDPGAVRASIEQRVKR